MTSPHTESQLKTADADTLVLRGQIQPDGVRFESRAHVSVEGGRLTAEADALRVTDVTALTIRLVAATDFANFLDLWRGTLVEAGGKERPFAAERMAHDTHPSRIDLRQGGQAVVTIGRDVGQRRQRLPGRALLLGVLGGRRS